MKSLRENIVELFEKGKRQSEISRALDVGKSTVHKTIKRFVETGSHKDRPRSGRPRTANTPANRRSIREKVKRNPKRSMRRMAQEIGISDVRVHHIVKEELHLKPYKRQVVHGLGVDEEKKKKNEEKRKSRCQALLRRFQNGTHRQIVFSDEKLFVIEEQFNKQNSRILAPDVSSANRLGRLVPRSSHPKSVMVWAGITSDGKNTSRVH